MKATHVRRTVITSVAVVLSMIPAVHGQAEWDAFEGNPVLTRGAAGEFDSAVILSPTVILSGDTLKMWYTGGSDINNPSMSSIGYATSTNGTDWTKYTGNPILTGRPSEWDHPGVLIPSVIADGDTLRMWYLGGTGPDFSNIGYATSTDGINWARLSAPVIEIGATGEWNEDTMLPGPVIEEDGMFKMWFSGGVGGTIMSSPNILTGIGYATSPDGINWTIYDDPTTTDPPYQFSDPVLNHADPGEWDSNETFTPSVRRTAAGYEMWYSGWVWDPSQYRQHIGYATSPDGINWTKYPDNPVGNWASFIVYPSVILDGDTYRMWCSRWIGFNTSIEYATAPITVANEPPALPSFPGILHPAFPNPSPAGSSFSFTLTKPAHVILRVYDLLGRELVHLVDESLPAGDHTAHWDGAVAGGARVSSGVFVVRLQDGEHVQSRRVTLIR